MINYDLSKLSALIFDVDGVLSKETISLHPNGEPMRTANIKDGYAIQFACKIGLHIGIISGGFSESVLRRYSNLGVKEVHLRCAVKLNAYLEMLNKWKISDEEVLFMGDDIPDYEVMSRCGCPVCPADACSDIKAISRYISVKCGGCGCCRDVIEQVLRAQGKWMNSDQAFDW